MKGGKKNDSKSKAKGGKKNVTKTKTNNKNQNSKNKKGNDKKTKQTKTQPKAVNNAEIQIIDENSAPPPNTRKADTNKKQNSKNNAKTKKGKKTSVPPSKKGLKQNQIMERAIKGSKSPVLVGLGDDNKEFMDVLDTSGNQKYSEKDIENCLSSYRFKDNVLKERFRVAYMKDFMHDCVFFLDAVTVYEKLMDDNKRKALGEFMRENFMKKKAPLEVNLSDQQFKNVLKITEWKKGTLKPYKTTVLYVIHHSPTATLFEELANLTKQEFKKRKKELKPKTKDAYILYNWGKTNYLTDMVKYDDDSNTFYEIDVGQFKKNKKKNQNNNNQLALGVNGL